MSIRVTCPGCNTPYSVGDTLIGKKVRCKKCGGIMSVAAAEGDVVVTESAAPKSKPRPAPEPEDEDDEEQDNDATSSSPKKKGKNRPSRKAKKRADVQAVAFYQKAILLCLLLHIFAVVLTNTVPPNLTMIAWAGVILVEIASAAFVFLLAKKVYSTVAAVFFAILDLIPYVALISLLVVNGAATRYLKERGIKVGLFGAKIPAKWRKKASQESEDDDDGDE